MNHSEKFPIIFLRVSRNRSKINGHVTATDPHYQLSDTGKLFIFSIFPNQIKLNCNNEKLL